MKDIKDTTTEKALLGCAIMGFEPSMLELVTPDLFHERINRQIWRAIEEVARGGGRPDVINVRSHLNGEIDDAYLVQLSSGEFVSTNWLFYVKHLEDLAKRRQALRIAETIAKGAHSKEFDLKGLGEIGKALLSLADERKNGKAPFLWWNDLAQQQFEPLTWIVDGLIPTGMAILAGRAKLGKSRLALQLCAAVASRGVFLNRRTEHGSCLYISLEMGERILQTRLREMQTPPEGPIALATEWAMGSESGVEMLLREVESERWRVVVVDTLSRFVGEKIDINDAQSMTAILSDLQRAAQEHDVLLLLVHHHNKLSLIGGHPRDLVADALGSSALSNIADLLIGFYKDGERRLLLIEGRETEPKELFVKYDNVTYTWQLDEHGADYPPYSERGRVWAAVLSLVEGGLPITTAAVTERSGLLKPNATAALMDLVRDGRLLVRNRGCYEINDGDHHNNKR